MRGRQTQSRKVAFLQGVTLFSQCSQRELREIAAITTEASVREGAVLATRGRGGREFFVIVEGRALVAASGGRARTLGPGDFFGELALLDGGLRTATVTADTDMVLLALHRGEFTTLLDDVPSVSRKMLAVLAGRLYDAEAAIEQLEARAHRS